MSYTDPAGKTAHELEQYLAAVWFEHYNLGPGYDNKPFIAMVEMFATDDFFKGHLVAKEYLKLDPVFRNENPDRPKILADEERTEACLKACEGIETCYLQQGAVPVDVEALLQECAELIALSDSPARKGLFCDIRRAVARLKAARGEASE